MSRGSSAPGTALSAMCWWSTGVDGMKAPTIAATCGAQMPGGVDDELGVDPAGLGQDGRDLAAGGQLEPGDADPGPDPDAQRAGGIGHRVGRAVRVEMTVPGEVDRAVQRIGRDRRHQAASLVGADDARVQPDPARPAGRPLELPELLRARCQPQAADGLEGAEASIELDAVAPEAHHRGRRVEGRDEPGSLAGGAGRELCLLDEEHVRPAGEGQVVGDAAASDPATDDDDAGLVGQ